jgi:FkbM family methyltransferase
MKPSPHSFPSDHLETWLQQSLPRQSTATGLLDIGAYHGDFTAAMLDGGVCRRAWLFEPNPDLQARLQASFVNNVAVEIVPLAVGSKTRRMQLKRAGHPSTASLLDYADKALAQKADKIEVGCTTLDEWWQSNSCPNIGLIKIDTQGTDLAVLEGGGTLLANQRPALVVELIFSTLYFGQCTPAAILDWAARHTYRLAGIFNEHYSEAGLLAFVDAVFIPAEQTAPDAGEYRARLSTTALSRQLEELQRICEERLALINSLHHEAAKRLEIINQLQRKPTN